jgi:hypothetical protein
MEAFMSSHLPRHNFLLLSWLTLLLLLALAGGAMAQADPPGRVAILSHAEGSVAFAPAGETEWSAAAKNRPITRGDRLWTDPGARAEVHLGSATLHMDSQTFVEIVALDDEVLQLSLNEGVVNARVRQLAGGDNFEITTPQLALRASQPGDFRIDVDPARGTSRITVRSGAAMIYGAGGGRLQLRGGQQMAFSGRDLAPVYGQPSPLEDGFDRWAADRNRSEDQSISAHYLPRDVVGYHELDAYGVWAQDPSYGAVWYPRVLVADWAPYRYGHWEWIPPWGWTWIDDAPWGFAPFHYGRWAVIGSRWCWVPGRLGPRPVYSPALVVFAGGSDFNLSVGSGAGIAWFPLAPGEPWRPTYRSSAQYLRNVNRNVVPANLANGFFFHQRRPDAITAVRVEDFSRGRPVHQHWNRLNPAELSRVPIQAQPVMPEPRRWADTHRGEQLRAQPRTQPAMPAIIARPQVQEPAPGPATRPRFDESRPAFRSPGNSLRQERAQEDQRRQQSRLAQPDRRHQQLQQQHQQVQQAQQAQQILIQRQRERHEQERAARPPGPPEHALRQQQAAQERFQQRQQQRAARLPVAPPSQVTMPAPAPQAVQPAPQPRGEARGRGPRQQFERAAQQESDGGGRGRGHRSVN